MKNKFFFQENDILLSNQHSEYPGVTVLIWVRNREDFLIGSWVTTGDGGWKFETFRDNFPSLDFDEEAFVKMLRLGFILLRDLS